MQPSTPSYYAVIPADVRYCKDIEPNAKLLYGEISALCNKEGFCWANNRYFADLYDVDVRTIKRWLQSLIDQNFIVSKAEGNRFNPLRKIYLTHGVQKCLTAGQKCHGVGTKMSPIILHLILHLKIILYHLLLQNHQILHPRNQISRFAPMLMFLFNF